MMTPVVHRWKGYSFHFFSLEESRAHLHVTKAETEIKIWLEPHVEIAYNHGVSSKDTKRILEIVRRQRYEFLEAWKNHHGRSG